MSSFEFPDCLVPSYFVGPCNQSVLWDSDGSVLYNATAPYVGRRPESGPFEDRNGTILYDAAELCMWVMPFDADPDVAGIGVILSFLVFSWFSFVITTFTIFFVQQSVIQDLLNEFDNILINYASALRRFVLRWRSGRSPSPGISKEACFRALIMLSDQQLVTGTAILVVSYAKHKTMTQYHFEVACTLAWMAYAAHEVIVIAALGHIRANPEMRWWRALWISVLFPMMFVSQVVTFHHKFLYVWGNTIQCTWNDMESGYPKIDLFMLVVLAFMVYGYINTMYSLYPEYLTFVDTVARCVTGVLRSPRVLYLIVRGKHEASLQPWKPLWLVLKAFTFIVFVIFLSVSQTLTSTLFSTIRLYIVLIWGTLYLVHLKKHAPNEGLQGSEDEWGFGQILPIILLALTFFGIGEVYHRDSLNSTSKSRSDDSSLAGQTARSDTLSEANTKSQDQLALLEESLLGCSLYRLFLVLSAAGLLAGFTKLAVVDGYVV